MHSIKDRRWLALAALVFLAPAARADMITPNSVHDAAKPVASANGTPVYSFNLVTNQYVGKGLNFSNSATAITTLRGIAVWAPVMTSSGIGAFSAAGPNAPVGEINYSSPWYGAKLDSPTTGAPIMASSLTVATVGNMTPLWLRVYGQNGQELNITPKLFSSGNRLYWTFKGDGISSFAVVPPPGIEVAQPVNANWGVAGVSFTPEGQTPEPTSLALAGLGVLGLALRFGWRRARGRSA